MLETLPPFCLKTSMWRFVCLITPEMIGVTSRPGEGLKEVFVRAVKQTDTKGAVLTTFADTISEPVAARLMKDGVAMLAGIEAGIAGIQAAVDVGAAWSRPPSSPLLASFDQGRDSTIKVLNEAESKDLLERNGIPVPSAQVVRSAEEAAAAAETLGYPVRRQGI